MVIDLCKLLVKVSCQICSLLRYPVIDCFALLGYHLLSLVGELRKILLAIGFDLDLDGLLLTFD